jgi:hypothetical protein
MKVTHQGSIVIVAFSDDDSRSFRALWPGSTVRGSGSFEFDRRGDLVDMKTEVDGADGSDWLAFSQDAQNYARRHARKEARKDWPDPPSEQADDFRHNPPAAMTTAPSEIASCGDPKDAIGAGAAAIGVNIVLGLVSGVAAALASTGDKSTPARQARAAKRGLVVGVGVHSVASLALGLATARTHPFFSGATTYIGLSGVLLTTVAVFVPAEQIAERSPEGTPLPSPSGTPGTSLPGPTTSPLVSSGGALGIMPGAPTIDPLRLSGLPRVQKSPMDKIFPGVLNPGVISPGRGLKDASWEKGAVDSDAVNMKPGWSTSPALTPKVWQTVVVDTSPSTERVRRCWSQFLALSPAEQGAVVDYMLRHYAFAPNDPYMANLRAVSNASRDSRIGLAVQVELLGQSFASQSQLGQQQFCEAMYAVATAVGGPLRIVGETYAPATPVPTGAPAGGSVPLTNGTPIVSEGDRRALRQIWKALSLPSAGLDAWFRNGAVDPDTVRAFQTAYNRRQAQAELGKSRGFVCEPRQLVVDGIIGRNTTAALQCMAALTDSRGGWSLTGNAANPHYGNHIGTVAPGGALGGGAGVLEVQVRSNTRTTIEVDGRALSGRQARLRLTPGRHLLRVLAAGCDRVFEADVDIVAGQVTPAAIDLFC